MKPENGHFYASDGTPRHFIECKTKPGQTRPTTIADARREGWLPSVTQVLKVLDKPALRQWLIVQAVHAVVTAPDLLGEGIDAKIERVLVTEKQQDEESSRARDLGSAIHEALELSLQGQKCDPEMDPYIQPVFMRVKECGEIVACEKVLVGDGYAGKVDLVLRTVAGIEIWDFKTTKKLPKASWPEAKLQTSAYGMAWKDSAVVATGNFYISTDLAHQGEFVECRQMDWHDTFENGFVPVFKAWCWLNNYSPKIV